VVQRYVDGVRVKDLNCLNRDLSRVIHVDWNGDACKLNPDNCLILRRWDGSDGDKSLFDLAQFIRAIATQDVQDVREVLSHYRHFEDPLAAFKERQRQLLQQEQEAQQMASQKKSLVESFKRS
jgi:import inner membrane translocase subunit TIM50